jgi:hypothetical protein
LDPTYRMQQAISSCRSLWPLAILTCCHSFPVSVITGKLCSHNRNVCWYLDLQNEHYVMLRISLFYTVALLLLTDSAIQSEQTHAHAPEQARHDIAGLRVKRDAGKWNSTEIAHSAYQAPTHNYYQNNRMARQ